MLTREHIIAEIKKIAETSGGRPPGRLVFERETGIRMSEWYGVHWPRWGDALVEAGYEPNRIQGKLSSDEVLRHYAEAVRHFGRVPAIVDIRMYSRGRKEIPGHTTFTNHFGSKAGLISALVDWVQKHDEFADLIELLPEQSVPAKEASTARGEGSVYLLKLATTSRSGAVTTLNAGCGRSRSPCLRRLR